MIMNYCGVGFSVTEGAGSSRWKWRIPTLEKTSGVSDNRCTAVHQAHEAIGNALRLKELVGPELSLSQVVYGVLHTLHGARRLPPAKAVAALRPFLDKMRDRACGHDRLAAASTAAVAALVQRLATQGTATDDLWEIAIDSSLSFANEIC